MPPIFLAKEKPTSLTNLSTMLSDASFSFSNMAVTTSASVELLMVATYRMVRSSMPLSAKFRALNQTPRLRACFLEVKI